MKFYTIQITFQLSILSPIGSAYLPAIMSSGAFNNPDFNHAKQFHLSIIQYARQPSWADVGPGAACIRGLWV